MATLSRVFAKLFGGTADPSINGEIGQFGSAKSGAKLNTADVATIQALSAYDKGWSAAVISTRNFPPIEEVTGVLKTLSYQACYLLQEGIPEWDATTVYSNTSVTKVITGNQLDFYISKREQSGNAPQTDNGTNWVKAIIVGDREIGVPQITLDFGSGGIPINCIELRGQAVSRTTYNNLFAIYGTTYGVGDGSTTFNLPDFSNRAIYGSTSAGYIEAGLPDLDLSIGQGGIHNHGASSTSAPAHTHNYQKTSSSRAYGDGSPSDSEKKYFVTSISNSSTATSSAGGFTPTITINNSTSHNHPLVVGANSIVGTADSVYTKGIKVRVYTRYQ